MIIKKIYLSIGLFIATLGMNNSVLSMPAANDNIIPNASYLIYDGVDAMDPMGGGISKMSRYATFYTFNGDPIETRERGFSLDKKLDPHASKPQPVSCVIKYWSGLCFGFGMYEALPGWFICFYDKNGNQIKSYRYDEESLTIIVCRMEKTKKYALDESNPSSIDASFPLDLRCIKNVEKEPLPQDIVKQKEDREGKAAHTVLGMLGMAAIISYGCDYSKKWQERDLQEKSPK